MEYEVGRHAFAKSTLQLFRAHLVVHDEARDLFQKSLTLAQQEGYMARNRKLRLALDTTNIWERANACSDPAAARVASMARRRESPSG